MLFQNVTLIFHFKMTFFDFMNILFFIFYTPLLRISISSKLFSHQIISFLSNGERKKLQYRVNIIDHIEGNKESIPILCITILF